MDDSDTAVMLAACGDTPARFGQVFERHHGAVWAVAPVDGGWAATHVTASGC